MGNSDWNCPFNVPNIQFLTYRSATASLSGRIKRRSKNSVLSAVQKSKPFFCCFHISLINLNTYISTMIFKSSNTGTSNAVKAIQNNIAFIRCDFDYFFKYGYWFLCRMQVFTVFILYSFSSHTYTAFNKVVHITLVSKIPSMSFIPTAYNKFTTVKKR